MLREATNTESELTNHLLKQFGPLLSQLQLAELLGRSVGGLRYSLCCPADEKTRALKNCGRKNRPTSLLPSTRCRGDNYQP